MMYEKDELTGKVKEFISIMKENNLGHLCVRNDKFEIELGEKPPLPPAVQIPIPAVQAAQVAPAVSAAVPEFLPAQEKKQSGKYIKSPIVGTFYASSAPGKPPYAPVGKTVGKGDVVFIIESMKLMNEVKSDLEGTVAEVLVSDGEAVEFDQPILRLQ